MGKIHVEDLKPGMVLASDLRTRQGRLLLPKGHVIDEQHILTCKTWGVTEADIAGASQEKAEAETFSKIDPKLLEAAKRCVKERFRDNSLKHPAMRELARQYVLRAVRRNETKLQSETCGRPVVPPSQADDTLLADPGQLSIEDVLAAESGLSSLPDIYARIVEAIKSPKSSAAYIAEVISKDVSLSAKLLRLVNSPFYGFPQKIDTLSRAVAIVGSNHLSNLALGISVISLFTDMPADVIDMKSFWQHSVACGTTARLLSGQINGRNEERFFVAGLLHDIGRLVMIKFSPERYLAVLRRMEILNEPVSDAERAVWGFSHGELAGSLLEQWKFPGVLEATIRLHHEPIRSGALQESAFVHLADIISHAMGYSAGCRSVPLLVPQAWDAVRLPLSALSVVILQLDHQLDEIMRIFFQDEN